MKEEKVEFAHVALENLGWRWGYRNGPSVDNDILDFDVYGVSQFQLEL